MDDWGEGSVALDMLAHEMQAADVRASEKAFLEERKARAAVRAGLKLPGAPLRELLGRAADAEAAPQGVDEEARRREAIAASNRASKPGKFPPPPTSGGLR